MVVALGAADVDAEKDAADVDSQAVEILDAPLEELTGAARLRVGLVRQQQLAEDAVPGAILGKAGAEVVAQGVLLRALARAIARSEV